MTHGTINNHFKPRIENTFRGAFWLPNGHSQTLWRKFAGAEQANHRRERLELADGDFIDLDWSENNNQAAGEGLTNDTDDMPIVLIIHGLCGCSESSYVLSLQKELLANGIASVAMNLRGCSGEPNRKAKTYHSGVSHDLAEVFSHLHSRFPSRSFVVIGYSLGGNVLLKWLGEAGASGTTAVPAKAIAVSTPFTLALCSRQMLNGFSRVYGRYFTKRLIAALEEKKTLFKNSANEEELEKLLSLGDTESVQSIWDFDERITAPLHGFASADDYYEQCSSIHFLQNISVPTLLIQGHNDPMIPPPALPAATQLSSQVDLELQDHGGHVGFVAGLKEKWLEKRISRYILNQ